MSLEEMDAATNPNPDSEDIKDESSDDEVRTVLLLHQFILIDSIYKAFQGELSQIKQHTAQDGVKWKIGVKRLSSCTEMKEARKKKKQKKKKQINSLWIASLSLAFALISDIWHAWCWGELY